MGRELFDKFLHLMGLYKAAAHKRNASAITNPVELAHDISANFGKLARHLSWPPAN